MNNQRGALQRPSEKRIENQIETKVDTKVETKIETIKSKRPTFATGLLTILLIISYIFTLKVYEPVNSIIVTGSILIYPFTFLVAAYISKYYGFKETRKSIFTSVLLFILFIVITMVCILPKSNNQTASFNAVIQYLYANNVYMIGDFKIFYPTLGQFLGLAGAFVISHLLFATIYNAIHNYTIDYLAIGLSIFIAAITDRIIFMPSLFLENLIKGANTFDYFIKCLTSEFIATIVATVIIVILYVLITSVIDAKKKKTF